MGVVVIAVDASVDDMGEDAAAEMNATEVEGEDAA